MHLEEEEEGFGESDLELHCGSLPFTVEGWKKDPVGPLREVRKKLNPLNEDS